MSFEKAHSNFIWISNIGTVSGTYCFGNLLQFSANELRALRPAIPEEDILKVVGYVHCCGYELLPDDTPLGQNTKTVLPSQLKARKICHSEITVPPKEEHPVLTGAIRILDGLKGCEFSERIAEYCVQIVDDYIREHQPDNALMYAKRAQAYYEKHDHECPSFEVQLHRVYVQLRNIYKMLGENTLSEYYSRKEDEYFKQIAPED